MAYLPKLNPTVGGGLGGLPERRATGGAPSANSIQRSIIGQAVKGSLAYRNTTTGDTYSLDPYEGLTELRDDSQNSIATSNYGCGIGMFADGSYVLVYPASADSNYVTFKLFSADGVGGTATRIDTIAVQQKLAVAINPTNDNFVVIYSGGDQIIKRATYTKAGVIVGTLTTITSAGPNGNGRGQIAIDFWDDGYHAINWVGATSVDGTNTVAVYNTSGTIVGSTNGYSSNYTQGRASVKCLSTSARTLAVSFSTSDTGVAATPITEVWQLAPDNTWLSHGKYVIAQDPTVGSSVRHHITYNDIDGDIASFYTTGNGNFHMAVARQAGGNMGSYGAPREYMLGYGNNETQCVISLGGDRFLVAFGYYTNAPLLIGIINSSGEWIQPPKQVNDALSTTVGMVSLSCSKATGRIAIAYNYGTAINIKIYNYRNTTTEVVRLQDQYPVKVAEFLPRIDVSNFGPLSINATQATNTFLVTWRESLRAIKWAIYTSGGTIVSGPFNNSDLVTSTQYQVKGLLLPNGNVVIITNTGSSQIKFGIYTPTNTLVGSITTVTSTGLYFVAEVANNGNFAICFYNNSNSGYSLAMYSQTGTVVGSTVTITSSGAGQGQMLLLFNNVSNNFFFSGLATATNYASLYVFSNTNTQVTTYTTLINQVCDMHTGTVNADGTVSYVALNSSAVLYYRRVTSAGASSQPTISMANNLTSTGYNFFALLPVSASALYFIGINYGAMHYYAKKIAYSNGASITTVPNSIGISTAWMEPTFVTDNIASPAVSYPLVFNSVYAMVYVTQSLNGDQYIVNYAGEVYRLSPSLPLGDYVIDGVVNTEAINGTCEIIQSGAVTRNNRIARKTPFIANGTSSKKIMAAGKQTFSSN